MVQFAFNAQEHAPNTGGQDLLPSGVYNVIVSDSEMKQTKRGDGWMLILWMTVIDGEQAGKRIPWRLNVQNPNQQAVEIAYGNLSAVCHCVGKLAVTDTSELHQIPFQIKVDQIPRQDDPSKKGNEIRGVMNAQGQGPEMIGSDSPAGNGAPTPPPTPATPAPAPTPAPAAIPAASPPQIDPPNTQSADSGAPPPPPWATGAAPPAG